MSTHPSLPREPEAEVIPLFPDEEPTDLESAITDLVARYGYGEVRAEVDLHVPARVVPSAPARTTDPETSHLAAKTERDVGRFSFKSRQARLLRAFATAGPLTDQGATIRVVGAAAPPSAWDGCRRRCSDLRAAGYLSDTNRRKRNQGSNEDAVIWQITMAGLAALDSIDETGWSR